MAEFGLGKNVVWHCQGEARSSRPHHARPLIPSKREGPRPAEAKPVAEGCFRWLSIRNPEYQAAELDRKSGFPSPAVITILLAWSPNEKSSDKGHLKVDYRVIKLKSEMWLIDLKKYGSKSSRIRNKHLNRGKSLVFIRQRIPDCRSSPLRSRLDVIFRGPSTLEF